MKEKYTTLIEKFKNLSSRDKITSSSFPVAKHWRWELLGSFVVFLVFVGVGVYAYLLLDLRRQSVGDQSSAQTNMTVPEIGSVDYIVESYIQKEDSFESMLQARPEAPDLGLPKVGTEEGGDEITEADNASSTEEVVE